MRLEYLHSGPNESGLIRLYDFAQEEVCELRKIARELASGALERLALQSENWVVPVGGCGLSLQRGDRDFGIREVGPLSFECKLSELGWDNVEGLLEPFCALPTVGFQWLTTQGKTPLLISHDGKW